MPIYEFFSPDTNRIYSFFARSLSVGQKTPRCPDNPKARMERMVSRFAVTGRAQEKAAPGDVQDSYDPKMESAMADIERTMSSMDENNPDPRQLGHMMRKMSEAAGQPVPEVMRQVIERLEKGEDPERLEAEYGHDLESLGDMVGEADGGTSGPPKARKPPQRDPTMYEMRDYVD